MSALDLSKGSGRTELVEPGRQRVVQRRRDRLEVAGADDGCGHLLDEQRYAVGALDDLVDDIVGQGDVARSGEHDRARGLGVESVDREHVGPDREVGLRPAREQEHERHGLGALGQCGQHFECRRIGPMGVLAQHHGTTLGADRHGDRFGGGHRLGPLELGRHQGHRVLGRGWQASQFEQERQCGGAVHAVAPERFGQGECFGFGILDSLEFEETADQDHDRCERRRAFDGTARHGDGPVAAQCARR